VNHSFSARNLRPSKPQAFTPTDLTDLGGGRSVMGVDAELVSGHGFDSTLAVHE
jgi:hypothetical protein